MNVVPNIQEILEKLKSFEELSDIRVGILVLLVALGSFLLGSTTADTGRASVVTVHEPQNAVEGSNLSVSIPHTTKEDVVATGTASGREVTSGIAKEGAYVGSKNGNKYHLPWCSGALRIKEENKVWFGTKEEAELAGYEPAGNCKGI